jgi:hypothetical protein
MELEAEAEAAVPVPASLEGWFTIVIVTRAITNVLANPVTTP